MASSASLARYILDRVKQDVNFLAENGILTRDDEGMILEKLSFPRLPADAPVAAPHPHQPSASYTSDRNVSMAQPLVSAPTPAAMPPPPSPVYSIKQGRAPSMSSEHAMALKRAVPPPPPPAPTPPIKMADYARALWDYNIDGVVS
jgi:hypothetical protein